MYGSRLSPITELILVEHMVKNQNKFLEEFYSSYKSFYQEGVCTMTLKVSKLFDDHEMCGIAVSCHSLCKSGLCVAFGVSAADQSVDRYVSAREHFQSGPCQCCCSPGSRVGRMFDNCFCNVGCPCSLLPLHPDCPVWCLWEPSKVPCGTTLLMQGGAE